MRSVSALLVLQLAATTAVREATASVQPVVVRVQNGYIQPNGEYVGHFTSAIQSRLVGNESVFPAVSAADTASTSLFNSTNLRYLELEGEYFCDSPLLLPSFFVLRLNGTLTDAANLSSVTWPRFTGMVTINGSSYTAVDGGEFNATVHNSTAVLAVASVNSFYTSIRNIRANAQFSSAVGINGGSHNEIANCECGGAPGRVSPVRAIWLLATSRG
eukprot:INCI6655.2.p1 GENE.INCI6655.2~~INCI6655.2.p1  ORF type:complete len:216 (-),score=28.48 INCI6655.2:613-1260(-)